MTVAIFDPDLKLRAVVTANKLGYKLELSWPTMKVKRACGMVPLVLSLSLLVCGRWARGVRGLRCGWVTR